MSPLHLTMIFTSAISIVLVFAIIITIHEFGHYIVAKQSGVVVPAFAIGFGPKLNHWFWKGTEFSIRLFPIGGLVQLAGEYPQESLLRIGEPLAVHLDHEGRIDLIAEPSRMPGGKLGVLQDMDLSHRLCMTLQMDDGLHVFDVKPHARIVTGPRSSISIVERHGQFIGKPLWKRMFIIVAGPMMNFLLAGMLFSVINIHTGIQLNTPVIGYVHPHTPASSAGLLAGDVVLSVNGEPTHSWNQLIRQVSTDLQGRPLTIHIARQDVTKAFVVQPKNVVENGERVAQIGIDATISHNPLSSFTSGFADVYHGTVRGVKMYGYIIHHQQFGALSGPVGVAQVISQQAQQGFWYVVMIAGVLSLNLGLFNLIPIPALDGGRLLFMIIEMIRGRAIDPQREGMVHMAGFAALMLFSVVITYHDVARIY